MCEGCTYWHGDYHRDMTGRSVEKIERDIEFAEGVLKIRESWQASGEGYTIRTREMRRNLEIDRETLAEVKRRIGQHEPGKTSNRGQSSRKSTVKNRRRNRG